MQNSYHCGKCYLLSGSQKKFYFSNLFSKSNFAECSKLLVFSPILEVSDYVQKKMHFLFNCLAIKCKHKLAGLTTALKSKFIALSLQDLHVDKLKQPPGYPASFSFHGISIIRKITFPSLLHIRYNYIPSRSCQQIISY